MALMPMMAPSGPAGPASAPTSNPGQIADGMSKVRTSVDMLESALPMLELGTPEHKAVLKAITDLSKVVPPSEAIPGVQMTQLAGLQQSAQESAPLQALARSMGQGPQISPVQ